MSVRRESRPRPTCAPEELLSGHPPEVVETARRVRELLKRELPGVEERGYPGWRLLGYRYEGAYLGFVQPSEGHVRLGFERGVLLEDEGGLLEGEGTQVRYVRLARADALPEEALVKLLRQAVALSRAPRGLLDEAKRRPAAGGRKTRARPPRR